MITLSDRRRAVDALAGLRRRQGLTQAQLATKLHVHRKTVCYRENALVGIETGELIRTAHTLGYSVALVPDAEQARRNTGTGWPA